MGAQEFVSEFAPVLHAVPALLDFNEGALVDVVE
jgi:hypothetical protein